MTGIQVLLLFALMQTSFADDLCFPKQLDCSALTEVLGCLKATEGGASYGKQFPEALAKAAAEKRTWFKAAATKAETEVTKAALLFGYGGATSAATAVIELSLQCCSFWDEHVGTDAMNSTLHSFAMSDLAQRLAFLSSQPRQLGYNQAWRNVMLAVSDVDTLRMNIDSIVHAYMERIGAAQVATGASVVGGTGCAVAGLVTGGVVWTLCGVVSGVAAVGGGMAWDQISKLKSTAQHYLDKFTALKINLNAFKHDIYCQPHTDLCGLKAGVTLQDLKADMKKLEVGASEISSISLFSAASNQVSIQKIIARVPQWVILGSGALCILVSLASFLSHSKRAFPSDGYVIAPE
jgi:hypothetical protein